MRNIDLWALTDADGHILTALKPISENELLIITGQGRESKQEDNDDEFTTTIPLSLAKRYLKALQKAVNVMEKEKLKRKNKE